MSFDVVDLRDFYATSLGVASRRMIRRQIRALWPDVSGLAVLGFGYATPYLRPLMGEAERVAAVMCEAFVCVRGMLNVCRCVSCLCVFECCVVCRGVLE